MFEIVQKYTYVLEKYSIDECFALVHVDSWEQSKKVAEKIKDEIFKKLDITVSIGVSETKIIAKTASKRNKPNGVCLIIPQSTEARNIFKETGIGKVWGIGGQSALRLQKDGIETIADFVRLHQDFVSRKYNKPLRVIWQELSGMSVMKVISGTVPQKSIQKTRTFKPITGDVSDVLSHLSMNIERAFWRVRKMNLMPREINIFLKTNEFTYKRKSFSFPEGVINQSDVIKTAKKFCEQSIKKGELYRATGITLGSLYPVDIQQNLFADSASNSRLISMYRAIDDLALKYGKGMVTLGTSFRSAKSYGPRLSQRFLSYDLQIPRLGLPFCGFVK